MNTTIEKLIAICDSALDQESGIFYSYHTFESSEKINKIIFLRDSISSFLFSKMDQTEIFRLISEWSKKFVDEMVFQEISLVLSKC